MTKAVAPQGLRVDLSLGTATYEELSADVRRLVLGGRGLGAYLLLREGAHDTAPLDPRNPLIFSIGPLTASGAAAAARYSLTSRSPLTETIFEGTSGGRFGPALRRLGLDYLIVVGACSEPCYLHVGDHRVSLLPAHAIWGLDVPSCLSRLSALHDRGEAAVIGPAGEHRVLYASVATRGGRHVGRGGLGSVMGSKCLKAVILEPPDHGPSPSEDNRELSSAVSEIRALLENSPVTARALPEFGTSILMHLLNELGVLPTRNFRSSQFELAEQISGESLRDAFVERRVACEGCFVGCTRLVRTATADARGPEYESLWALGADCGIGDLGAIVEANHACNCLGLDTITLGATVACAMELSEAGVLPDGPRFGDAAALLDLVPAIALRQGLGDDLAEGSRRFAARCGRPELSMHVKSLELPAFDPRGMTGQGLAFATSNRGACHLRANMLGPEALGVPRLVDRFAAGGKADPLAYLQDLNAVLDSLPHCKFAAHVLNEVHLSRLLSAVAGETVEPVDLLRTGERIWNLERLFNLRAGFTRADDTLPRRLLLEPVPDGPSKGHVVNLSPMLEEYYTRRRWDANGIPTAETLAGLEIESLLGATCLATSPPLTLGGARAPLDAGDGQTTSSPPSG